MAAKQGGNGKQSSQSDKNYWARLKAAGGSTKHKAARIKASAKSVAGIDYGRAVKPRPVESVVFSGTVKENFPKWEIPPVFVIADGITIDVQARENDAMVTFRERRPGSFTRVIVGETIPRVIASAFR
jgi:hypothetical protein